MTTQELAANARYPIGKFVRLAVIKAEDRESAIRDLADLPSLLRTSLEGLDEAQLATPYREGGWTIRQVAHHIADSHMNASMRVRKALTEENPLISVYDEKAWAELADSKAAPVEWSLDLLANLHKRWVMMLEGLSEQHWQRSFVHPESGAQTVEMATLLYAWHSRHHLAHIREGRIRAS